MSQVVADTGRMKIKAYLQLIRAPGLFSIITNILASFYVYSFLVPIAELSLTILSALLVISALCYQSGMILNDIADFSEDSRERAFRPLPSGRLNRNFALYGSVLLLAMALMLAFSINESLALAVFALIILIFSYNFLTKESGLGPINMGLIRMVNWLLVMIAMQSFDYRMLLAAGLIFAYTIIVTIISRFETVDFSKKVKPLLLTLAIFMLALSIFMVSQIDSSLFSLVLFVFIGWLFWMLFRFSPKTSQDTQQFVTLLLKSMVILDGVILFSFGYLLLGIFCSMFFLLSSKLAKYVYMT